MRHGQGRSGRWYVWHALGLIVAIALTTVQPLGAGQVTPTLTAG